MDANTVEIECPVCDRKIRDNAPYCPYCGAEFAMSGIDELERVAREMNGTPVPNETEVRAAAVEVPVAISGNGNGRDEEAESKGFLGSLFRKRRQGRKGIY